MKNLLLLLVLLLPCSPCLAAPTDNLLLVTEEYPPLNYTEDGLRRGIATDFLVEMLGATGSLQSHNDIASIAWARGYQLARTRPNILLFSVTRTPSREALFYWIGPILQSKIVLLARKERGIKLDNLQQLQDRQLKVGVVLEDIGHQLLKENHVPQRRIYPTTKGAYLAAMLAEDRVDLIAYDVLVSRWDLRQLGYDPDDFEVVYTLQQADYYYCLSLKSDRSLAELLQKEFDRLKGIGRLDEIIAGYLQ